MIKLTLETLAPIHLSSRHSVGPLSPTLDYIPGRTIRGAIADFYLQDHDIEENRYRKEFTNFFDRPGNWYGPFWPLGTACHSSHGDAMLFPRTTFSCKLRPGFNSGRKAGHGVRDMLFAFLQEDSKVVHDRCHLGHCMAELVPFAGYYTELDQRIHSIEIRKRLLTRTAIDSRTETAQHGQLFTLEVIEEEQCFSGVVSLENKHSEKTLRKYLSKGTQFWLGGARTRGLGLVKIIEAKTINSPAPAIENTIVERLEALNSIAKQRIEYQTQAIFTLTLLSDCIIRDKYLRYRHHIVPDYLGHFIDPTLATAIPLGAFCRTRLIDGWNASHRLPRNTVTAIMAGSVFIFGIDKELTELASLLESVEKTGLGEKRAEGFGRIVVAHPFHLNLEPI